MKLKIFTAIVLLMISVNISAQPGFNWSKTYNGTGNFTDAYIASVTDNAGNIYSAGYTWVPPGNFDILLVKYDSAGTQQWVRTYNGLDSLDDIGHCISIDDAGNVYVGGQTNTAATSINAIVLKYNSSGTQQWKWEFSSNNFDIETVYDISVRGGFVYVTGQNLNVAFAGKINASTGTTVWTSNSLSYGDAIWGVKVGLDNSGNVFSATHGAAYRVVRFDSLGNRTWTGVYDIPTGSDYIFDMQVSPAGDAYVTGIGNTNGALFGDILTVKFAAGTGDTSWVRRIDGPAGGNDYGKSIRLDNSGNLYVMGLYITGATTTDVLLIKYTSSGSVIWQRNLFNDVGAPKDLEIDQSGNVIVAADSISRFAATLVSSNGQREWTILTTFLMDGNDLHLQNSNSMILTGKVGTDALVAKYSNIMSGIQITGIEIPIQLNLSQNYPNPFNPMTKIKFDIPKAFNTKLAVYDILGKEVALLVNENLEPGSYEIDFSATELPSGTYFYRLETDGISETKKMLLIK